MLAVMVDNDRDTAVGNIVSCLSPIKKWDTLGSFFPVKHIISVITRGKERDPSRMIRSGIVSIIVMVMIVQIQCAINL